MKIAHLCVLIPANNEEKLLSRCLHSILKALACLPQFITFDIILCVDASSDNTKAIGKELIGTKGTVLEIDNRNVGIARRYAALEALNRYSGPLENCWLANTDADCEVPPNWLQTQICWANKGFEGVAGIVKVDTYFEHETQVQQLFEEQYVIHADGSHPHIHGANLGIRADIYIKSGGWRDLATAEDHDLWNRLSALNCNLVSLADLFVITSGRRQGRAPHGFAGKVTSYNGSRK